MSAASVRLADARSHIEYTLLGHGVYAVLMSDLIQLVLVLGVFFGLIGLAWLAAIKLGMIKPAARKEAATMTNGRRLEYRVRERVLSPGECAFLPVLREAVQIAWAARKSQPAPLPVVLASVRLAEVLEVTTSRAKDPSGWQSAFNKINSKQVDFVICDAATTRPLVVVELDDRTHGRADRQDRDAAVDQACASASLPVLHVRAAGSYNAEEIAKRIVGALSPAGVSR